MADPTDASSETASDEPELDADGRLRPAFVRDFPEDPELKELVTAFERGDFRTLRERVPALMRSTPDPAVKDACAELLRRIRPDPMIQLLLFVSLAFFAFLASWAYLK